MGKQKKSSNSATPKAYTIEELEEKIKSAEGKITFIQRRIERIIPYLNQSQTALDELIARKTALKEELKKYTGFLAQVKFSLKAVFSKTDNEAKRNQEEISLSIEQLEPLIAEKEYEIKCFEEAIANNSAKIEEYQSDSKRWQTKLKKRGGDSDSSDAISPKEPGDI